MEYLLLEKDFSTLQVIDSFSSIIWTDRYSEYGDFEIEMPLTKDNMLTFSQDRYIYSPNSEHLMIIEKVEINSEGYGKKLIVSGRSLESILDRRIVWGQRIYKGNVQSIIGQIIDESFINPEIEDRRMSNFIFKEDPKLNDTVNITLQYTGDCVYDIVTELCDYFGLGFKIVLDNANNFVFSLYKGINRSYDQIVNSYVIFSPEYENLSNTSYVENKTVYKNVGYVAGEDEGADRKVTIIGQGTGLSRRELFIDARDISSVTDEGIVPETEYMKMLEERGNTKLEEYKNEIAFDGESKYSSAFIFGKDYNIGDIVEVLNEYGVQASARITEMIMSEDVSGSDVYPTFSGLTVNN